MNGSKHMRLISRSPRRAQTALQLKYDTILVYLENGLFLTLSLYSTLAAASSNFNGLIQVLPYKGFFGGGGGVDVPGGGGGGGGGDGGGDGEGGL